MSKIKFDDEGYRWREDEVEELSPADAASLLIADARDMLDHHEPGVAYEIVRELVWRSPNIREGWLLLAQAARSLNRIAEADAAEDRANALP